MLQHHLALMFSCECSRFLYKLNALRTRASFHEIHKQMGYHVDVRVCIQGSKEGHVISLELVDLSYEKDIFRLRVADYKKKRMIGSDYRKQLSGAQGS